MLRKKSVDIRWQGAPVQSYYDIPYGGENRKFFDSFIKNEVDYNIGDSAIFSIRKDNSPLSQKICGLKYLFEEGNEFKAVVIIYELANEFHDQFSSLNIEYDTYNEVVFNSSKEIIINLCDILRKCRVIHSHKDDCVEKRIDLCNLNRNKYFLCRYKLSQDGELVPFYDDKIDNENTYKKIGNLLTTPSRKIMNVKKSIGVKKNNLAPIEDPDVKNDSPLLSQARRNLNSSFNDSLPQDEKSCLNYFIVEQDNEKLKIKLRVSNGKVLSKIPTNQPVVLLDTGTNLKQNNIIYELNSPKFRSMLKKAQDVDVEITEKTTHPSTPDKVLRKMVEDMKIKDKTPVKSSPRKLRRLGTPFYNENNSDTDSDDFNGKRKMPRDRKGNCDSPFGIRRSGRVRKSSIKQDFEYLDQLHEHEKKSKSVRKRKLENQVGLTLSELEDYNSDIAVDKTSSRSRRKLKNDTVSTPSRKSIRRTETPPVKTNNNFEQLNQLYENEKICKSIRKPKNEKQANPTVPETNDLDSVNMVDRLSTTNSRKMKNDTLNNQTPSAKNSTPKTKLFKGTPLKMIRNGTLTPSIDQRLKVVEKCGTPLILARNTLHVSYVPKLLPCREKEYRDVFSFIMGKLRDKCGGCMYISGVPGTGKTATVTAAIENITKTWRNEESTDFNYVCINGMKLTEPRQCYVEILRQLTGKRVPWEQALTMLEKQFTIKSAKKVIPTVLLIDELDILCTKRQDVVYNLLDWPTKTNAQLIVVTIANTMDLPERLLMSRVTSRLGLTRLTFQAYTHKQLQEIVVNRLSGNDSFRADAIQFVARKVASVSGDARRALDICRRSAEIAELEGPNTQVSMQHVNAALDAMITQPKVKAILHCSKLEKLLLKAVIAEVERTGLEETIFEDVCMTLNSLATLEGFKMVSLSLVTAAVYKLTSCRLLLSDQNYNGLDQRILLNVSSDDVYFALKKD